MNMEESASKSKTEAKMQGKRSRAGRSASCLNLPELDEMPGEAPEAPKQSQSLPKANQSGPVIFTLEPVQPQWEKAPARFLESCFNCGKCLGPNVDIFMFGCFKAFCSSECREWHAAVLTGRVRPAKNYRSS